MPSACCCRWPFVSARLVVSDAGVEERIVSVGILPSPEETFATFPSLWFDRALTRNVLVTVRRLSLGFGLAALVGIPLGVLCGCFTRVNAFFLPLSLFGRNIPLAALVGLMVSMFGIDEQQKVMFIFFACVAFILSDTARAIEDVGSQYVGGLPHSGGQPVAGHSQGLDSPGDAERVQFAATAVRTGIRLYHAGRSHQFGGRVGRYY